MCLYNLLNFVNRMSLSLLDVNDYIEITSSQKLALSCILEWPKGFHMVVVVYKKHFRKFFKSPLIVNGCLAGDLISLSRDIGKLWIDFYSRFNFLA